MTGTEAAQAQPADAEERDALLVHSLRAAEPAAYAALCERFGPRIYRFALARLSGDGPLAEDVMVQTLADAVTSIGRFDSAKSTFSAWLHGIAQREIYRELRKQKRLKSPPQSAQVSLDSTAEMSDPGDLAAGSAARLDAQRQVAALAAVLSRIEFDVLVLSCVAEFSAREIGHIVGRSERAVHSILHRARRKARERLMSDEQ